MKLIYLALLILSLSACQMTSPVVTQSEQEEIETTAVPEDLFSCPSDSSASNDKDGVSACETEPEALDGVAQVIHPLEPIDIEIKEPEPEKFEGYTNLWDKVASEFTFAIPQNQSRLDAQRNWYLRHPAYMNRVSKRAKPFLYYIVQQLEAADMPLELALLPIVESAFDPFAYSHGRASGMWQFIPGTGKRFGMKQTWWYDGRRDVVASTQGAIKYMKYLHKMFDGDWLHALAAYNSGEGRVMRAIKKNKRAGKAYDFWSLSLPRETRAYVPKLLALADILKRKDNFNFAWPSIANAPVIEEVETGSQIDLALAASMAGLSIAELQGLNPGFNRWATDPDGPHTLLLPLEKAESFKAELAQTSSKDRLNWVRHKVRNGDSLGVIANKYSSSIDVIKQVNNLRGNTIYVNDYVLVPVSLKELDNYSLSADQRLAKMQSIARAEHKIEHTVRSGDTLWDLAMAHKVGVRDLAKWNKMAPTDPLKVGAKLVVWTDQVPVPNASSPIMRNLVYTVRNGDSLARIASRFKVKVADLTKWNNLSRNKYLQPGQKLKIKVDVTRT